MPAVTGSITDIVGSLMADRQGVLKFRLNAPNIQAGSSIPGTIHPTAGEWVTPDVAGDFSVNLRSTTTMLTDAWYVLEIHWLDGSPMTDFPQWQIRVPSAGGLLVNLISTGPSNGGGGGANPMVWWVGLTPPPHHGLIWNYLDPDNPDGTYDPIPELTLGDIVTKWW